MHLSSGSSPSTVVQYPALGDSQHTVFGDLTALNLQFLQMSALDRNTNGSGGLRSAKKPPTPLRLPTTPTAISTPMRRPSSSSTSKPIEIAADTDVDFDAREMMTDLQNRTDHMWELMRKNSPRDGVDRDYASCQSTDNGRTDAADDDESEASLGYVDEEEDEWDLMVPFDCDDLPVTSRSHSRCSPPHIGGAQFFHSEVIETSSIHQQDLEDDEDIFGMEM